MSDACESKRDWRYVIALAIVTLIAVVRVASTHRVFSEVLDEPAHLAAGFDWFKGDYTIDSSHPPLARILCALPLKLAGFPDPAPADMVGRGNELLYYGDRYEKTLARARMGNLVLLIAAILGTAAWARRAFSKPVAILSAAVLSSMPAVLGHAGLITTDLAVLATLPLALFALDRFVEKPTMRRGVELGLTVGLGLVSKFSFVVFFVLAGAIVAAARWLRRERTDPGVRRTRFGAALAVSLAIAFVVTWAFYRFHFAKPSTVYGDSASYVFKVAAPKFLEPVALAAANIPMPAPEWVYGLGMVKAHDKSGHDAFLLGSFSRMGWWYYFPVVFFYKTPLPFMLLALWGSLLVIRERDLVRIAFFLSSAAVMAMAMTSSINIGVRHVLPVYAGLSVMAAYAIVEIWKRSRDAFGRTMLAALVAWLFAGVAIEHPDYLAWFNELAQPNPAHIAVDSNLDWGQDSLRLVKVVRQMQIETIHADILTNVRLDRHGLFPQPFNATEKVPGWLAISETRLAGRSQFGDYSWLGSYRPVRRVGKSIRLYYIP